MSVEEKRAERDFVAIDGLDCRTCGVLIVNALLKGKHVRSMTLDISMNFIFLEYYLCSESTSEMDAIFFVLWCFDNALFRPRAGKMTTTSLFKA